MASAIDPTKPSAGAATTASVRANFQAAHDEIEALQAAGAGTANRVLRVNAGGTAPESSPICMYDGAASPEGAQLGSQGDLYKRTALGLFLKGAGTATVRGWAGLVSAPGLSTTGDVVVAVLPGAGETITVTRGGVARVFEWRPASPPAGGTAGRIWVYVGADAGEAVDNLFDAMCGAVDPARFDYNGLVPHPLLPTLDGDTLILSLASAIVGDPIPYDGVACSLATTMVGAGNVVHDFVGFAQPNPMRMQAWRFAITAAHVTSGKLYMRLPKPFLGSFAIATYHGPGGSGVCTVTVTNSFSNCLLKVEGLGAAVAGDYLELLAAGI